MSEEAQPLLFEVADKVATITLNRADRGNSINPAMMVALEEAWARVMDDDDIVVVVLTAAGPRHFCTGADVGDLHVGKGGLNNVTFAAANKFSPRMCDVTKPVICAVNGLVNGGGLHFVADSDIVIAPKTAQFMDTHTSIGLVSALESIGVARRAGMGAALLMGLAGRGYRMPAERAYQLGLIDILEETAEDVQVRAQELAKAIAANSPQALKLTKRAIWAATEMPDPHAHIYAWELLKSQWAHPDFEEGPKAFSEKREPNWNPDPNARRG